MPGTKNKRVYNFPASQINEGGIIGNVEATGLRTTDGIPAIKFVLRYHLLKEK